MDLNAQGVAEAVAEVFAIARVGDDLGPGLVDLFAGDPGVGGGNARQLGAQNGVVYQLHFLGGLAHRHGAGHVGAVAVDHAAKIHGDELAALDDGGAGDGVGFGTVGTAGHDGVEGVALGAFPGHDVGEPGGHLALCQAGLDKVQNFQQRLVGDPLGLPHGGKLACVLDLPQGGEQLGGGEELGLHRLCPGSVAGHGHILLLKAQLGHAVGLDQRGNLLPEAVPGGPQDDLRAGDELPGGLNVPGVGVVPGFVRGNEGRALPVEAHGVELAGLAGDQHSVQAAALQGGGNVFKMGHLKHLLYKYQNNVEMASAITPHIRIRLHRTMHTPTALPKIRSNLVKELVMCFMLANSGKKKKNAPNATPAKYSKISIKKGFIPSTPRTPDRFSSSSRRPPPGCPRSRR